MTERLLRLLQLSSPALPIGAFHFSQALEYAVHAQWVRDEATAQDWIGGLAQHALGTLDLPVLARLHAAWTADDSRTAERWNAFLTAARESEELRLQDRHTGNALQKILVELGLLEAAQPDRYGYAAMFALACARWGISMAETLQAYAWALAENQVLAAVKLVPLGQTAGQRILHALIPMLALLSESALSVDDDCLGVCAVMHGIGSARHETQYTRLFRS